MFCISISSAWTSTRPAPLLILMGALTLTGCAQLPSSDTRATIKSIEQYQAKESLVGNATAWPQEAWWRAYGDAQLDALINEALKDSPTMTIAEARLRRALAMTQVVDSASQPQLNAVANPSMQKQSYNHLIAKNQLPQNWHGYGFAALNFNWEIDFWGKNRAAVAAAKSMQEASRADVAQARLTLATSIAFAYGELARMHMLHDTAKAAVAVRTKTMELLQMRHAHGLETMGAIKLVESRKASAEEEVLALEEQMSLQRNRIAALLGAGPDRGLRIARPTINVAKKFELPKQLQLELLGRRADIVAARSRVEAMEQNVERQKAEFYPNVNLSAMIGLQSLGLGNLTKSGSYLGNVGPVISLPILTGGRLRGQLRGAQAEHDEAVGVYNQTVSHALEDVANAAISQRSLGKQIEKGEEATHAAQEAHRIMNDRYKGGLANYLAVLSAEEALIGSQRNLRDMQSRSFMVDVALIKSLGGGYQTATKESPSKESPAKDFATKDPANKDASAKDQPAAKELNKEGNAK